ncbi:succinylglutamate desuccinylase [Pseudomonas aeruginosa]|uniref:succinylglutamate desuccinylase n=1 Tax=Pseudomonas aeruginosa TaxID=287 RepID=UPI000F8416CF|nr:succinylglutamate desuccinylase [Pseudomonas aeruginosa]RTR61068.1 succinylglutamate desuccinylase [Pseudomonas aeruginosa]
MSLVELLPLTLASQPPALREQRLAHGVTLLWLAEGVLQVEPDAALPGHLLLSAGIHGNETAPVEWLDRLLCGLGSGAIRLRRRLLLILGNPAALRAGTRYVESDLNRLFNGAVRDEQSEEGARAAELERLASDFFANATGPRLHYDLHTAIRGSQFERFALFPWHPGRPMAEEECLRLGQAGMQALLSHNQVGRTFSAFTQDALGAHSFTLELGKARPFGANAALDLSALDRVVQDWLQAAPMTCAAKAPQRFRVAGSVIKRSPDFVLHLAGDVENFTPLTPGSLLAEDGDERWQVSEADARILFPNPTVACGQRAGLIVVRECVGAPDCGAKSNE